MNHGRLIGPRKGHGYGSNADASDKLGRPAPPIVARRRPDLAVAHARRRHHPQSVPALAGPADEGLTGCDAMGLINLIYNLARYEQTRLLPHGQVVRLKLLPRTAACLCVARRQA
jgi:hypothetical protein